MHSLSRAASAETGSSTCRLPVGPRLPARTFRAAGIKFSTLTILSAVRPHHSTTRPEVHGQAGSRQSRNTKDAAQDTARTFADKYDMNFWSYQPWWWQPSSIVIAGGCIVALFSLVAEDHVKALIYTSIPVVAWGYVFLRVVPCQFRSNAVTYLETHDLGDLEDQ